MSRLFRAAGLAAAAFAAVLGTPSLAWEFDTPTLIAPGLGTMAPLQQVQPLSDEPAPATAPQIEAAPQAPAAQPEPPVRRSLAELVGLHSSAQTADAEQECLANAVYFESKGEPLTGQPSV